MQRVRTHAHWVLVLCCGSSRLVLTKTVDQNVTWCFRSVQIPLIRFLYVLCRFGIDCLLLATNLQTFKTSIRNIDYSYAYLAVARWSCLSVRPSRPSVRPSHAGIVSKRLHISTKFFHRQVVPPFCFFLPNGTAIFRRDHPERGRRMQGDMKKSRFSTNISGYLGNDAR